MIVVIDNYDSFTYNLVQRLGEIDPLVNLRVVRNDEATPSEIESLGATRLLISPGPCTPNEAGISVACVSHFLGKIPVLGVCLGHQSIGQALGATIVRAPMLMHGKTDAISHDNGGLFKGIESPLRRDSISQPRDRSTDITELLASQRLERSWPDQADHGRATS